MLRKPGDVLIQLFEHQQRALTETEPFNRVAYYHDMGLGKTFTGSEKLKELNGRVNLVICQKSKIDDWIEHFNKFYNCDFLIFNLTNECDLAAFMSYKEQSEPYERIGVINYELTFRRPELLKVKFGTVLMDESSLIQNETAKRTKFIMKLKTDNVILLSGTPTGGKYEKLYSQLKLLGLEMTKKQYWNTFVNVRQLDMHGFKIPIVTGYKNIGRLKRQMRKLGCNFMKTDDVFSLPDQTFTDVKVNSSSAYKQFVKDRIVVIDDRELVGDLALTKMLYERQLCGVFSDEKYSAFCEMLNDTDDRLIVFYNFDGELNELKSICKKAKRPVSEVNGHTKDLDAYETKDDSVTLIQYQAGAMGLNLQKSNKIIYFTPPLSSELYEQSKKRIHRIGQSKPCFYYRMICKNSIENKIYSVLEMRQDYTQKLFESGCKE